MTLQQLADKCGENGAPVSESQMSRIEREEQSPRPKLRSVLAEILGLDINLRTVAE